MKTIWTNPSEAYFEIITSRERYEAYKEACKRFPLPAAALQKDRDHQMSYALDAVANKFSKK